MHDDRSLEGAHAVITGGGRGIGLAIARTAVFARRHAYADRTRSIASVRGRAGAACRGALRRPGLRRHRRHGRAARVRRDRARGPAALDPRQQCGRGEEREVHVDRRRALAGNDRRQPDRNVQLHARGAAHARRGEGGPHRQHREHRGARRLSVRRGVLRRQARRHRPDARACARARGDVGDRECRVPRLHRHGSGRRCGREHRREDRQDARRGSCSTRRTQSAEAPDRAR